MPRFCFNDNQGDPGPYVYSKVPTLYTAVTTGLQNDQRVVYGHVHPLIAPYGEVVDIVVNNHGGTIHPFHLHGHQFQVIARPGSNAGTWPGVGETTLSPDPPSRDTVDVYGNSYVVIRFRATNPGVYLFHCHIDWHIPMGLSATLIEAPERLRDYVIPPDHITLCEAQNIPMAGNAGGDERDVFDTSHYNKVNDYPYTG
jgi:iron transport multicopper oxidase